MSNMLCRSCLRFITDTEFTSHRQDCPAGQIRIEDFAARIGVPLLVARNAVASGEVTAYTVAGKLVVPFTEMQRIGSLRNSERTFQAVKLSGPIRSGEGYALRRAPWQQDGYSLWTATYERTDSAIRFGTTTLIIDDLPDSALRDFWSIIKQQRLNVEG